MSSVCQPHLYLPLDILYWLQWSNQEAWIIINLILMDFSAKYQLILLKYGSF